ncbi:MAG: ribonuclease III [Desulfobacteraceae bacterium]|nr:MAG: ribonuclease III [Desulfobacteraceae bacterium]
MDAAIHFQRLQDKLGYCFNNPVLLEEALRHSSFVNEQTKADLRDNERMEFLGDAVLNLVIGHLLMRAYPDLREGDLSRIRSNMVNEAQLADIARSLGLGSYLQLGKGEMQTGGHDKNSILANALEALIAAVYLDSRFEAAFSVVENQFQVLIDAAIQVNHGQDYKSRLQEAVQGKIREVPRYRIVEEIGPDHDKTFCVAVTIGDVETHGTGKSKKLAEQDAARQALEILAGSAKD